MDHVKDYPSKGLSSVLESPESDNEEEFFIPPAGVSSDKDNTLHEESNTSATSAQVVDPVVPRGIDHPIPGPVELPTRRYAERQH